MGCYPTDPFPALTMLVLLNVNVTSKTLLLVDDNDDDTLLFERALRKADLPNPLAKVHSGTEALMYVAGEDRFANRAEFPFPSVLFLDLGLPGISGFDTLQRIRTECPRAQLPIVVLTGSQQLELARTAYALGADFFLPKPAQSLDLLNLASIFRLSPKP